MLKFSRVNVCLKNKPAKQKTTTSPDIAVDKVLNSGLQAPSEVAPTSCKMESPNAICAPHTIITLYSLGMTHRSECFVAVHEEM